MKEKIVHDWNAFSKRRHRSALSRAHKFQFLNFILCFNLIYVYFLHVSRFDSYFMAIWPEKISARRKMFKRKANVNTTRLFISSDLVSALPFRAFINVVCWSFLAAKNVPRLKSLVEAFIFR